MMEGMKRPSAEMTQVYLTGEEIDALAVAVARSVDPHAAPRDAFEASVVTWGHREAAGPVLCSLATMLAEAQKPDDPHEVPYIVIGHSEPISKNLPEELKKRIEQIRKE